jgi:hypothetical protein
MIQYTFLIIYRLILLRMRNISGKPSRENRNTHFMFNNFFFKRSVYEINIVEPDRPQMAIWRIACWVTKATNTHLEFDVFLTVHHSITLF